MNNILTPTPEMLTLHNELLEYIDQHCDLSTVEMLCLQISDRVHRLFEFDLDEQSLTDPTVQCEDRIELECMIQSFSLDLLDKYRNNIRPEYRMKRDES